MADTRGIRAGRAYVELGASDAGLVRGLQRARALLAGFGQSMLRYGLLVKAAGATATGALLYAAKGFADAGAELHDLAGRTGLGVEALSELQYAAEQSGTGLEQVEIGLRKMQSVIADAAAGSDGAAAALGRIGLSVQSLARLNPQQQFELIAAHLAALPNPTQRAAAAVDLLGRSGTALLPMIGELEALRARARALGLVMSTADAAAADALGDAFDRATSAVRAVRNAIGAALAPVLTALTESVTRIVARTAEWLRQHREVVILALRIAAGVVAAGGALLVFGGLATGASAALGGLLSVLALVKGALVGVGTLLAGLASPAGVAIAALAALGTAVVTYTDWGGRALTWLRDRFRELSEFVGTVAGGIVDALQAGDLGLAAEVLWAGLQVAWETGAKTLREIWVRLKSVFIRTAIDMWYGARVGIAEIWYGLRVAWIETVAFLSRHWATFTANLQSWMNTAAGFIQKRMQDVRSIVGDQVAQMWNDWADANQKVFDQLFGGQTPKALQDWIDLWRIDLSQPADKAKNDIDAATQKANAELEKTKQDALAESETDRAQGLSAADEERNRTLADVGRKWEDADRAEAARAARAFDGANQKLQDAKDALTAARKAAADARAKAPPAAPRLPELNKQLADAALELGVRAPQVSSLGTFNPAAVGGLGGESQVVRLLKDIRDDQRRRDRNPHRHRNPEGPPVFAR